MFRILLLFTIVFISQPGLGQQTITMGGGLQGEYGFMGSDSHIKGSKYFFKEWGLGKIFFTDGKSSDNGLLQVDLELDQLLVNSGSDKTKGTLVDIDKVQKFTITEFQSDKPVSTATTFVKKNPVDFEPPAKGPKYYRQLTTNSDHVLVETIKYLFDHAQDNTSNYDKKNYKEYRSKTFYHILDAQGIYRKSSSLNERAFTRAYPNLKKELKDFIKHQGIDFENPQHLDLLISFCHGNTKG